jgi:uncharacterized protein (TIGR03086 family)
MSEPVDLLARALDQAGGVVAAVGEDQVGLPTPCSSWDVAALRRHLVHDLSQFTVAARGERPDWTQPAPDAGPDWAGAFRVGAGELLEEWRKADLSGTVELPGVGEVPARFQVDQAIAEIAVHTWDLATATGQPTGDDALDPEVAETALTLMRGALRPEFRGTEAEGKAFASEKHAPADASAYTRLAAFAGRVVGPMGQIDIPDIDGPGLTDEEINATLREMGDIDD